MKAKMAYMRKTPAQSAAILYLLIAGLVLFPTKWAGDIFTADEQVSQMLGLGIVRTISAVIMLILGLRMGIDTVWGVHKGNGISLLIALPAVVIALNNLPLVALINGTAQVTGDSLHIFAFALECVGVGLFEEVSFRGVIFPFVLGATGTDRKGRFWGVIVSAAAFGLLHLVNLLGGFSVGIILQVGYSFLIGSMLAVCTFRGCGVFFCAGVHSLFNFCGSIVSEYRGLGVGSFTDIWCPAEIVLTVVVSLAVIGYFIWILYRSKSDVADSFAVFAPRAESESETEPSQNGSKQGATNELPTDAEQNTTSELSTDAEQNTTSELSTDAEQGEQSVGTASADSDKESR